MRLMKYFKKITCVLLTVVTVLTGCSIGGREIVMDINSSSGHTLLVIDKKKCNITEAKLYLANYKNLYGDVYGVNLYKTKDASKVSFVPAFNSGMVNTYLPDESLGMV